METYAEILNGEVLALGTCEAGHDLSCAPPMERVICDATVQPGWTYDGATFAAPVAPSPAEADYVRAAQALLDTTARARGYDGILSLASYVDDPNPAFAAEAVAGKAWRSAVWTEGYSVLAQVQAQTMAAPTIPAFLALLPTFVWPA